ncbi:MAG: sulfatase-like hydrolase/transferase [Candidatus Latescibacteria bacterium]|nr:sulfatase-like hydrolase/transferase [Candidatus Latescibacterota bacterium]
MKPPNLIYIFADDMGYGDVSCLNEKAQFKTANLDRLAAEGMRCTDAHSSSAVCTPSRYSVLTGRYNWRSVLKSGVTGGYSRPVLEEGRLTAASMLKEKGYKTACVGKWHLGLEWRLQDGGIASTYQDEQEVDFAAPITDGPVNHGFDYYFGISASLDMPPYVYIENDTSTSIPTRMFEGTEGKAFMRPGLIGDDFTGEEVLPKLGDKVEGLIDQYAREDDPFFIYFPLPAPHTPILPIDQFQGKSGTNEYGDFCLHVDDTVGRVMKALERNGLDDDTIVVFTADNGCSPMADFEELAACGHQPSYVYRGHKADIFEGGHRIPFIVRWPEIIAPGAQTGQTFCLTDLTATMAEITGHDLPDKAAEDSVSNLSIWDGTAVQPVREATVHHSINGSFSIRQGKWKLEMCAGSGGWSAPRPGKECEGLPPIQLYDLANDIGERQNIYDQYPKVVEGLRSLLTRYVENGRSTPGARQSNTGEAKWEQLWWMQDT